MRRMTVMLRSGYQRRAVLWSSDAERRKDIRRSCRKEDHGQESESSCSSTRIRIHVTASHAGWKADGFHVLTAVNLLQGLELAEMRTPDAIVWSDGADGDRHWTVCHFLRSQLAPRTRAILRGRDQTADRDNEANAGYVLVALGHESSAPNQLALVLDDLI